MVGHECIKVWAGEGSHCTAAGVELCQKGGLKMAFIFSVVHVAKAGGAQSRGDAKDDVGVRSKHQIVELTLTGPA